MALNIGDTVKKMAGAASAVLSDKGPDIQRYAQTEFTKIAQTIQLIVEEDAEGRITKEEAKILLDMQRQASRSVLTAIEVMGALAAEQAINAALDAVRDVVNGTLGWALL